MKVRSPVAAGGPESGGSSGKRWNRSGSMSSRRTLKSRAKPSWTIFLRLASRTRSRTRAPSKTRSLKKSAPIFARSIRRPRKKNPRRLERAPPRRRRPPVFLRQPRPGVVRKYDPNSSRSGAPSPKSKRKPARPWLPRPLDPLPLPSGSLKKSPPRRPRRRAVRLDQLEFLLLHLVRQLGVQPCGLRLPESRSRYPRSRDVGPAGWRTPQRPPSRAKRFPPNLFADPEEGG